MNNEETRLEWIDIELIDPDPNQPRKDMGSVKALAEDMDGNGQIQPIIVIETPPRYRIVDGQRRWEGAKARGECQILCLVVQMSAEEVKSVQFRSNFFRKAFSPFELAAEFSRLVEVNSWSHQELATYLGIQRSAVSDTLALLSIPKEVQKQLLPVTDTVSKDSLYRVARASSPNQRKKLVEKVLSGATAREVREAAREGKPTKKRKIKEEDHLGAGQPTKQQDQPASNDEGSVDSASNGNSSDQGEDYPDESCTVGELCDDGSVHDQKMEDSTTQQEVASEPTVDEQIVRVWWEAYTVHAVRMSDIKSLNPPLAGKKLEQWIKKQAEETTTILEYRLVMTAPTRGNFIYQLVPDELYRKLPLTEPKS